MGNTQPTNKTGKRVVVQKLETAKKTGILSLTEHNLEECPPQVYEISNLKTLDLSKNELTELHPRIAGLKNIKSLNLEHNKLAHGTIAPVAELPNLQNLNLGHNMLGQYTAGNANNNNNAATFQFPATLKQLKVHSNLLSNVPTPMVASHLIKLEKLDLSKNRLFTIPVEIANLKNLTELLLDNNLIVSLPTAIGELHKLKVLSLKDNDISTSSNTTWSDDKNPQPLPKELFTDTPLIDLNLHGNPMTSRKLNEMEGFDAFLERRKKVKTTTLMGGGLTSMDVCGLEDR